MISQILRLAFLILTFWKHGIWASTPEPPSFLPSQARGELQISAVRENENVDFVKASPKPSLDVLSDSAEAVEVLDAGIAAFLATNKYRESLGNKTTGWSQELYKLALRHTYYMAKLGKINHDGFDDRFDEIATHYSIHGVAENVAYNMAKTDAGGVLVYQWINSPGHRANMIGDYEAMVVAVVKNGTTYYGTQMLFLTFKQSFVPDELPGTMTSGTITRIPLVGPCLLVLLMAVSYVAV